LQVERRAISSAVIGGLVVVILVVAGVGGYILSQSSASGGSTTHSQTLQSSSSLGTSSQTTSSSVETSQLPTETSSTTQLSTSAQSSSTTSSVTQITSPGVASPACSGEDLYDPFNGLVYVTVTNASLSQFQPFPVFTDILNGTRVIGSVPVAGPMVCNPANGYVYIITGNLALGSSQDRLFIVSGVNIILNESSGISCGSNVVNYCNGVGGMLYDSTDQDVYIVASLNTNTVVNVVQGANIVSDVVSWSGVGAGCMALDSSSGDVYVGASYSSVIDILRGTSVSGSVTTGLTDCPITYDSSNGYIYVGQGPGGTSVVDGSALIASIKAPVSCLDSHCLLFDAGNSLVYAEGYAQLNVIDGTSLVGTLNFTHSILEGMVVNQGNQYLYLTDAFTNGSTTNIDIILGTNLITKVAIDVGTVGVDPVNGYTYMLSAPLYNGIGLTNNTLLIVSGRTIVANETLSSFNPVSTAYDPTNGEFYAVVQPAIWEYGSWAPTGVEVFVLNNTTLEAALSLISS